MMDCVSMEEFVDKLDCNVYPITIIKFILNRTKIINCFKRVEGDDFKIKHKFKIDHSDCVKCNEKKDKGILCRQHTSIYRVLNSEKILYDMDTGLYLYQNEIYKMVNDKLVIVYCPHPKLIEGEITDSKVRKIITITIDDKIPELNLNKNIKFFSSMLMNQQLKCWFNNEFSLITIPNNIHSGNWCLVSNRK